MRHPAVVKLGAPPHLSQPSLDCLHDQSVKMKAQDLLEARAAAALTLREFDRTGRRMNVSMVGMVADMRELLVANLLSFGGEAWDYCPSKDNSWIVDV